MFQAPGFQVDAFQTGFDYIPARGWLVSSMGSVREPRTAIGVILGTPRGGDTKGAATGAFEQNYNKPAMWQRVISPGQRFTDVAVAVPQGWWVAPVTVAVELLTQVSVARPPEPIETFYAQPWPPTGATTAQAIRTAVGVAQIVTVIDTFYPQSWHARVATTLTPMTRQAVAQVVAVIDTFYPRPWPATVTVTLAPMTVAGEIVRPWKGVETFYPQAWPSAAQTAIAPQTAAFVVQIVTRIETFYAQAWTASVNTILAPVTRAGVAQIVTPIETFYPRAWLGGANVVLEARSRAAVVQVVEPVDTFYPQGWAAGAATGVQLRTWAGEVPRTPQIVETLYLRGDWNWRSATLQQPQTATAAIYVHQDYQPPATPTIGGNWVVAIDVRQLAYTNINWPGIGSIAAWAPPEAPPPPDVVASTFIHRHRRRGRR